MADQNVGRILPLLLLAATAAAQGLTPTQVMKLRSVSQVYDTDRHGVLFTRSAPRLAKDGVGSSRRYLFQLRDGRETLLLKGGSGFTVQGKHVTYVGRMEKGGQPEVLAKSLVDGKVRQVTKTPNGVRSYQWSPNFDHIAYTQLDPLPQARVAAVKAGFKQKIHDEDYRPISLWLWTRATGEVKRLTEHGSVFGFVWSKDSTRLALALAPRNLVDDSYMFKRIHLVDRQGNMTKLVDNPGKLGDMAWSPDGKTIAYISAADPRDPHAGMLYAIDVASREVRPLTEGMRGMVHHIHWRRDQSIQALVSRGVKTYLTTVDANTAKMKLHAGGEGIAFTRMSWHGNRVFAVGSKASHPPELFKIDPRSGAAIRLTNSNRWLKNSKLGRQDIVLFAARDGLEIEGLLMYPLDYKAGKRYPMVIVVHGGPEAHFSEGWNTSYSRWGQMLCARGYFAWYPNYRSSTGYGVAFTKHDHGDLMGGEFHDHVDAIAHFANKGLIDKKRVGIGGGSYGGYTAAWGATKGTDHIAAAVSFVPFVDVRTKWYTSDIPWEFYFVHYQETHAHEQVDYLADHSPLTFAAKCRTPLLLLGGTADPRVHPSQPHMLYRAVKFSTKTPVRYVQYPGEGHGNRTNTNQYDYAVRTLRWFDHYLKPGDHRADRPPPFDIDYSAWYATR